MKYMYKKTTKKSAEVDVLAKALADFVCDHS